MNLELANRLLRTKHESWSYEQEVRMFVKLTDEPDANGLNWIEFGSQLHLREVIIGAQCDPNASEEVEEAAKSTAPRSEFEKSWESRTAWRFRHAINSMKWRLPTDVVFIGRFKTGGSYGHQDMYPFSIEVYQVVARLIQELGAKSVVPCDVVRKKCSGTGKLNLVHRDVNETL